MKKSNPKLRKKKEMILDRFADLGVDPPLQRHFVAPEGVAFSLQKICLKSFCKDYFE
jgi:hypothetical protein